jgi:hypothetical protein
MWASIIWGIFFLIVYGGAVFRGWRPPSIDYVVVGVFLISTPWVLAFLFWRKRLKLKRQVQRGSHP